MGRDYIVMLLLIGGVICANLIFVNKKNLRKAFLAAMTAQLFTWPIGLLIAMLGKVEYPVRLFPKAIDSSFLHGFIMNPVIYAIYYIHYPKRAKLVWRRAYTLLITAIPISAEVLENKYTNLIKYKDWTVFHSWIIFLVAYIILRKYLDWFFNNVKKPGESKNEA